MIGNKTEILRVHYDVNEGVVQSTVEQSAVCNNTELLKNGKDLKLSNSRLKNIAVMGEYI